MADADLLYQKQTGIIRSVLGPATKIKKATEDEDKKLCVDCWVNGYPTMLRAMKHEKLKYSDHVVFRQTQKSTEWEKVIRGVKTEERMIWHRWMLYGWRTADNLDIQKWVWVDLAIL